MPADSPTLPTLSYYPELHPIRFARLRLAAAILLASIALTLLANLLQVAVNFLRLSFFMPSAFLIAIMLFSAAIFLWCLVLFAGVIPNPAGAMSTAGKLVVSLGIINLASMVIYVAANLAIPHFITLSPDTYPYAAILFFFFGLALIALFAKGALLVSIIPFMRRIFAHAGRSRLTIACSAVLNFSLLVYALNVAVMLIEVATVLVVGSARDFSATYLRPFSLAIVAAASIFLLLQFLYWFLILLYAHNHMGRPGIPTDPAA